MILFLFKHTAFFCAISCLPERNIYICFQKRLVFPGTFPNSSNSSDQTVDVRLTLHFYQTTHKYSRYHGCCNMKTPYYLFAKNVSSQQISHLIASWATLKLCKSVSILCWQKTFLGFGGLAGLQLSCCRTTPSHLVAGCSHFHGQFFHGFQRDWTHHQCNLYM